MVVDIFLRARYMRFVQSLAHATAILAMSDMGMGHGGSAHAGMHHGVSESKAPPTTPTVDMRTAHVVIVEPDRLRALIP